MPIDARIPLAGRIEVPLNDSLDTAGRAFTLADMIQRKQAGGAYAINPQTGEVDVAQTRRNLAAISPELVMKFDREQSLHNIGMLNASRQNEETQRRTQEARLRAAKQRAGMFQDLTRQSLLGYYQALQQGGDEQTARQAGDQIYKAGLTQLHQAGAIGPNAMNQQPVSFDPDRFHSAVGMSEDQWTETAAKIGDMDMGEEGGYQDGAGAAGGGGMVPAAFVQGQAPQGGMPGQGAPPAAPMGQEGGFVQTATATKAPPPFTEQDTQALPDVSQAAPAPGKGYNWQKAYQYTQLRNPKVNPASSAVVYDYRTGQPIQNEPVISGRERVARANKAEINVAGGDLNLGKAGATKVDEGLLATTGGLMRLSNIERGFKPEFQQIATRGSNWWSSVKEKLGADLSTGDKKNLTEFTAFKRDAIENLNLYIKEITGAQMSIPEAERITKAMPNPGSGMFDGDSPTEFQSKLTGITRSLRQAAARYTYIKRNGMQLHQVPLEQVPQIMNERGKALEAETKKKFPSMNAKDIQGVVKRQLAQEFGLVE